MNDSNIVLNKNVNLEEILDNVREKATQNERILSVILRGSYPEDEFFNNSSDIDLSIILEKNTSAEDIIGIKLALKKISEIHGIILSSTILDISQLKEDLNRGIHLHGAISSSYVFQLSTSRVIYGEEVWRLFSYFNYYDVYTPYFNAVRFVDKIFKDYFQKGREKKGINYSFILARECMVTKGIIPYTSCFLPFFLSLLYP